MRDLNKVMIIGNLTRDPEIRSTNTGQTVASFSVASNRSWNDAQGNRQDAVEYVNVVAWGKLAEIVGQIYRKGRRTYIEGRLQTRSWDAQDGTKRYRTEVVASDLILLDRPPQTSEPIGVTAESPSAKTADDQSSDEVKEDEINIEDIPF